MAADKGLAKSGNRRGEASVHIQVTPQLSKDFSLGDDALSAMGLVPGGTSGSGSSGGGGSLFSAFSREAAAATSPAKKARVSNSAKHLVR